MDRSQELPLIRENQTEYVNPPIQVVETEKAPHTLALKLGQVRSDIQAHVENFSLLVKSTLPVSDSGIVVEPISFGTLFVQIEELDQTDLSPPEFLKRSGQILDSSKQFVKQAQIESNKAQNSYDSNQANILNNIQIRKDELKGSKGLTWLKCLIKHRKLKKQDASLSFELKDSKLYINSINSDINYINIKEKLIIQKQDDLLQSEAFSEIKSIKIIYKKIIDDVVNDPTIKNDIQKTYIDTEIVPLVDTVVEYYKLSENKKTEFYSALQNCLNNNGASKEDKEKSRQEFDSIATKYGFDCAKHACNYLLNSDDTYEVSKNVSKFIAKIAASDITEIKTIYTPKFTSLDSSSKFDESLETVINPDGNGWRRINQSFEGNIIFELLHINTDTYPHMGVWSALKSSPSINEIFGDLISVEDAKIYNRALEKSLTDATGHDIKVLSYYPTPEAIKTITILAATDKSNSTTTSAANEALCTFARRSNYKQILDNTELAYPAIKSARPLLEGWKYYGQYNNPQAREAFKDITVSIIDNDQDSELLKVLATKALTNHSLLERLIQRGILTKAELNSFEAADSLLQSTVREQWQKYKYNPTHSYRHFSCVDNFSLNKTIRENLLSLTLAQNGEEKQFINRTKSLVTLSQSMLKNKNNYLVLNYLSNQNLLQVFVNNTLTDENTTLLTSAYEKCPSLLHNDSLLLEFCKQFTGIESVSYFNNISVAYGNQQQLLEVIKLVGSGVLTQERSLELNTNKAQAVFSSPRYSLVKNFPRLYLETDDGLDFFNQSNVHSLFSLDKGLDNRIGKRISHFQIEGKLRFTDLLINIAPHEIEQIDKLLSSKTPIEVNQQNWQQLLMGYVRSQSEIWGMPQQSEASIDRLNTLFNDSKVRDICLNGLRDSWITYLKSGKTSEVPFSLNFMSEFINYCGGVGPLSQIESLHSLINSVNSAFSIKTTAERTKLEVSQGLVKMEERFTKEKWSNESRTDFYNISRDILGAAPSLFSDYLGLFDTLTPSQMRSFAKDLYPLYRTKLVFMEKKDYMDHRTYDKKQLLHIRKEIVKFADIYKSGENSLENQKQQILLEIQSLLKDRFGINKIPQEFTSEHMRSFTNISTYLANLHNRNEDKETILGFYLSMMINNQWNAFRQGETINPEEYLITEKSSFINKLLQERQRLNPLTSEHLGISEEEIPEFLKLLQKDTQNIVVGNIETIDIKLTNIIQNLRSLEDLDLYPDQLDKQRMQLLLDWGNKRLGSVVARMYQSLTNPNKVIKFSEEDINIQKQISETFQQLSIILTPQKLKEHFQDGIKPLATVVNLLNFIGDAQAESEISTLKEQLKPTEDVIQVFKRLGEDFKPNSGAMALSQDLNYLDNLIVKREEELTPVEKSLLTEYTTSTREQIVKLEGIYGQIKNKFGSLKQGNTGQQNLLLQDKLNEIDRIINTQTTQQAITSTVSNNLNTIIENIRECLSCTREGCNNDTNLTFGNMNKFYLYSQSETQQNGSISDQIVFVEPVSRADGTQSIAFVLDRLYGTNTPTILENHIEAVLKKYRSINQRFPNIKLFVFVSEAAASTAGTSLDMIQEMFKTKNITTEKEFVEVDVTESATGDHYIELGGLARTAGKRQVNGLVLSL